MPGGNGVLEDPFCTKAATDKTIFYESKRFMVLYDIKPVVMGHCLFIPKRHVVDILELSSDELSELLKVFGLVVPRMLKLYGATENSYDLTSQIGPYSGRTVPHLHIHLLPRSKDDMYQREDSNIFEDIKNNRSNFSISDVDREVAKLRIEFRYKQGSK